jgi:hypothetical protein
MGWLLRGFSKSTEPSGPKAKLDERGGREGEARALDSRGDIGSQSDLNWTRLWSWRERE